MPFAKTLLREKQCGLTEHQISNCIQPNLVENLCQILCDILLPPLLKESKAKRMYKKSEQHLSP